MPGTISPHTYTIGSLPSGMSMIMVCSFRGGRCGPQRDVERVVEAGLGGHQPVDGVDQPADRGGVAARGPVPALVGRLDRDLDARAALDHHPVRAVAAVGRHRPVRGAGGWIRVTCSMTMRGSPSTMPCTSNRSAPWVPASNSPIALVTSCLRARAAPASRGSRRARRRAPGPSAGSARPTPWSGRRRRPSAARSPSAGPCRPGSAPSPPGRRWSSRRSPGSGSRRRCRQPLTSSGSTSLPQPGSTPQTNSEPPPPRRRPAPVPQLGRGVALVVERVQRGGDDHGPGAGARDVGGGRRRGGCRRTPCRPRPRAPPAASTASMSSVAATPSARPSPPSSPASRPTLSG